MAYRGKNARRSVFWPVGIGAMLALGFTLLWYLVEVRDYSRALERAQDAAKGSAIVVEQRMSDAVSALDRMADRWGAAGGIPQDVWVRDAQQYVSHFRFFQAIEWADEDFFVRYVEPLEGNEAAVGLSLAFEEKRREALEKARESGARVVTPTVDLIQGGKGFLVAVPIGRRSSFSGFVVGVFQVDDLFGDMTSPLQNDFWVHVEENNRKVYSSIQEESETPLRLHATTIPLESLGSTWMLHLIPNPSSWMNTGPSTGTFPCCLAWLYRCWPGCFHVCILLPAITPRPCEQNNRFSMFS